MTCKKSIRGSRHSRKSAVFLYDERIRFPEFDDGLEGRLLVLLTRDGSWPETNVFCDICEIQHSVFEKPEREELSRFICIHCNVSETCITFLKRNAKLLNEFYYVPRANPRARCRTKKTAGLFSYVTTQWIRGRSGRQRQDNLAYIYAKLGLHDVREANPRIFNLELERHVIFRTNNGKFTKLAFSQQDALRLRLRAPDPAEAEAAAADEWW